MLSSGIQILTETTTAAAAVAKNRFIGFDGNYPAGGNPALGITHFDAAISEPVAISTLGVYPVESGGVFAVGDALEVGVDGRVIEQSVGTLVARARQESTAANQVVDVYIIPS